VADGGAIRTGTATVLFTDLVGSTQLRQSLGDERADDVRRAHDRVIRDAIAAHAGTEIKGTGDGFMATFPAAAEAVSAAVAMQRGISRMARRGVNVAIRVGISAGDVAWEDGDCFGTPVVEASRLCDAAETSVILTSEVVRLLTGSRGDHLFQTIGPLELKGLDHPLTASEVIWSPSTSAPVPLPATLASPATVAFVGREVALDQLQLAWKRAADDGARLVVLSGEPGVGKTRLVSELARRVHDEGAVVLFGRCDEDRALPYQPFAEALTAYVAAASQEDLAEQTAAFGGDLARLVPQLGDRVQNLAEPLRADPEIERFRLFESVAALLRAIAAQTPTLLVLDDLHWAGKPELLLVRHLLRTLGDAHLLIIGTYRDTDLDRRHPLAEALGDLRREKGFDRVDLEGLAAEEVAEFLERAGGRPLGADGRQLARDVHKETEGNPFFVGQLLRHLVESGSIVERDGEWVRVRGATQAGIPEGIREVIGRRLSALSPATNEVLAVASVIGREFALDVIRAASALEADALLDALEEAEAAHLIEPGPDDPRRRSFVHALLRSTLYDEIPTTRRLRIHRRAAQAFEAKAAAGEPPALADLARHYAEAASLGESDKALHYAGAAAQQALDRLAYEEAASFYDLALDVLDPAVPADQQRRGELLVELGRSRWASGDRAGARDALYEAADLARALGDARLFALASISSGTKRGWIDAGVVDQKLIKLLEEALTMLPTDDDPLRALCMARLSSELYFLNELSDRRRALADDALAMARRVGDTEALGVTLSSAHWGAWSPGNAADRLRVADEMLALALECGDRELEASALIWRINDLIELERTDEAVPAIERALAVAVELRQPEYLWAATLPRATLLLMAGDYDAATEAVDAALAYGEASGGETPLQMYGVQQLHLTRARGGVEGMLPLVAAMVEQYPLLPAWRAGLAFIYREMERPTELREQLEILARDDFGTLPRDANWSVAMLVLGTSCAYLGDVERCRSLYEKMLPYAGFAVTIGAPADCLGPMELYLAPLAAVLGDYALAAQHHQRGVEAAERMHCPTGAALATYEYAFQLLRYGGEEQRDAGVAIAEEAVRRATQTNAPHLAARAKALLDKG
jgi:predicted ATPase/class 3 adenylate cyclase